MSLHCTKYEPGAAITSSNARRPNGAYAVFDGAAAPSHDEELFITHEPTVASSTAVVVAAATAIHADTSSQPPLSVVALTGSTDVRSSAGTDAASLTSRVVWSSGGRIVKSFTVNSSVDQFSSSRASGIGLASGDAAKMEAELTRNLHAALHASAGSSTAGSSSSSSSSGGGFANSLTPPLLAPPIDRAGGGPVLQAAFCSFADVSPSANRRTGPARVRPRSLCILQSSSITVYESSGAVHVVSLPCPVRVMWPMLEGLLLERTRLPHETSHTSEAPTLFSLLHPLEELRPLSMFVPDSKSRDSSPVSNSNSGSTAAPLSPLHFVPDEDFVCDPMERVVFTSTHEPFLMTYNERTQKHTLWCQRQKKTQIVKRLSKNSDYLKRRENRAKARTATAIKPAQIDENKRMSDGAAGTSAAGAAAAEVDSDDDADAVAAAAATSGNSGGSISTEIVLDCVWRQEFTSRRACSSVFLCSDIEHQLLVCLYSAAAASIDALRLVLTHTAGAGDHTNCQLKAEKIWDMAVTAAVPVAASAYRIGGASDSGGDADDAYAYDILALESNTGLLGLYTGNRRICTIAYAIGSPLAAGALFTAAATADTITTRRPPQQPPQSALLSPPAASPAAMRDADDKSMSPAEEVFYSPNSSFGDTATAGSGGGARGPAGAATAAGGGGKSSVLDQTVVDIRDPVSNRVTIVTGNGSLFRCTLQPIVHSPLVWACMSALGCTLPPNLMHSLRVDLVTAIRAAVNASNALLSVAAEWAVFCRLLIELISESAASRVPSTPARPTAIASAAGIRTPAPRARGAAVAPSAAAIETKHSTAAAAGSDDDWNQLIASDFHRTHSDTRSAAAVCTGGNALATAPPASIAHVATDRHVFRSQIVVVLRSLHLLYEECKMNALTAATRTQTLASDLLLPLAIRARRRDYVDHYLRDYPPLSKHVPNSFYAPADARVAPSTPAAAAAAAAGVFSPLPAPSPAAHMKPHIFQSPAPASVGAASHVDATPPADIYRWLLTSLRIGTKRSKLGGSLPPYPLFLHARHSPCELSRKICRFYDLLTRSRSDTAASIYAVSSIPADGTVLDGLTSTATATRPGAGGVISRSPRASPSITHHGMMTPPPVAAPVTVTTPYSIANRAAVPFSPASFAVPQSPFGVRAVLPSPNAAVRSSHRMAIGVSTPTRARTNTPQTPLHRAREYAQLPLFSPAVVPREVAVYSIGVSAPERVVLAMVEEGFTLNDLDRLPVGVALPLREALRTCRASPPSNWPREAFELVGRSDLARMIVSADSTESDGSTFGIDESDDAALDIDAGSVDEKKIDGDDDGGDDVDGTLAVAARSKLLFSRDLRLKEVRRLLRSNRVVSVSLSAERIAAAGGDSAGTSDELVKAQHQRLQLISNRTLAQPIGRGMYTLGSLTAPPVTESLPVPPFVLTGRVTPRNTSIKLDQNAAADDYMDWPSFHNGVAAGLRVAQSSASSSVNSISRTWIMYNRPPAGGDMRLSFGHAGFLFALGLRGHLSSLSLVDIFGYLQHTHEPTTIAVLLGTAASNRGSMDPAILKQLCLHIPALLPGPFAETGSYVQTASLLGIGLLFQGTANRLMTEMLLAEIGRRPTSDKAANLDRESHSLAAGLALGLVTLGCGSDSIGLADLGLESRLSQYIVGGHDDSAGLGGFDFGAGSELKRGFGGAAGGGGATDGKSGPGLRFNQSNKCSTIKEDDNVNVDVTAPGATLALGLMFMKRNARAVAARLSVPDTHFMFDYVRPDFILLRVLSRNLIMWDSIEPSIQWVQSHMTRVITDNVYDADHKSEEKYATAGGSAPSGGDAAADLSSIRQAYCNVIAGAVMALGLRYAGTGDDTARAVITHYVEWFSALRIKKMKGLSVNAWPPNTIAGVDRATIETGTAVCVLALGVVMSGTGDVASLRVMRSLRTSGLDAAISHGTHMAIHMAIGFLFLGGGRYTLTTSTPAIAALVCALFPRFPQTTNDNRYHLQPFRHLYVLAMEPRYVEARDVDTGRACVVPLRVQLKPESTTAAVAAAGAVLTPGRVLSLTAPCLLPEFDRIASIRIAAHPSSLYCELILDIASNPNHYRLLTSRRMIFVKRRAGSTLSTSGGNASTSGDGESDVRRRLLLSVPARGMLSPFGAAGGGDGSSSPSSSVRDRDLIHSLSADPTVIEFARHFCGGGSSGWQRFSSEVVRDCLMRDKPELIRTYLTLAQTAIQIHNTEHTVSLLDLKLAIGYYKTSTAARYAAAKSIAASGDAEPLLATEFLTSVELAVTAFVNRFAATGNDALRRYVTSGQFPDIDPQLFGSYVVGVELPTADSIKRGLAALQPLIGAVASSSSASASVSGDGSSHLLPFLSMAWPGLPSSTLLAIASATASKL